MSANQYPMQTNIVSLINMQKDTPCIFGKNKHYIVPEYQREYSWGEKDIDSLAESLERAIGGNHVFMGTVQFNIESANSTNLYIIDGQQRMTTLLLLFNILGKLSNQDFVQSHNMQLEIRNFVSNNDKLTYALQLDYTNIDNATADNNRYIANMKLLKAAVEDWTQTHSATDIADTIAKNVYFVELVTTDIPLPQVVDIFNTINTTGLDLNSSDLFKLQYYEYLRNKYPIDTTWMRKICDLYELINKHNQNMNYVLDIYKCCIVAKHKLGWEMLSKSNEAFFDEIFGKKASAEYDDILQFDQFSNIVDIYLKCNDTIKSINGIHAFATDVIGMTRYGRYWILPYVAAYFNGRDYELGLQQSLIVAKYFIVCSVNYDKWINPVQTFICNKVLPALSKNEQIAPMIQDRIREVPYDRSVNSPNDAQNRFKQRLKENLKYNAKRADIVCRMLALLEEIEENTHSEDIKTKLFTWDKFKYDIEHIYAVETFKNVEPENISLYNGIGNLVVLNRSINRSIKDKSVCDKVVEYESSAKYSKGKELQFVSVARVAQQIRQANNTWGKEQVEARCTQQTELLCKFLGLN